MSIVQLGQDINGDPITAGSFGFSVALSADGKTVVIGDPDFDASTSPQNFRGQAKVYDFVENTMLWVQRGNTIEGADCDSLGTSVAISSDGNTIALGLAAGSNGDGKIIVLDWVSSAWVQRGTDILGNLGTFNFFGSSVSLSDDGNTVAGGAPDGATETGYAKIFDWNGSSWVQRGVDILAEATGDRFGFAISLSANGNIIAIGGITNDAGNVSTDNRGHVRIFEWNGSAWIQRGADIDGEAAGDNFGRSVSLSADGNIVAIGAPFNDADNISTDDRGSVRVFVWNGSAWIQRGSDIDGKQAGDNFGRSVSLSDDGNILAIGANQPLTGSGYFSIFNWNGSSWMQNGDDISGNNISDRFGISISISANGNIIAIGAFIGQYVKVFEYPEVRERLKYWTLVLNGLCGHKYVCTSC